MSAANVEMLREIPLFGLLDSEELASLAAQLDRRQFWAGQIIFQEGDRGGAMYVIQSGKVELFIKDRAGERVTLSTLSQGHMFGEFSLLDDEPRSASAKALEETTVFIVDRNDLDMLFKSHPHAAFDMMAMLSRRIRETDILLSERVLARNVNEELARPRTFSQRLADLLATVAGDMRFVYFSAIWFTVWIIWNLDLIPGIPAFDPFPFGLLTMIVSLEAIFLSTFVLVSQNRQAERDKVRNDIEYEINVRAELKVRELHGKVDEMQDLLLRALRQVNSNIDQLQTGSNRVVRGDD